MLVVVLVIVLNMLLGVTIFLRNTHSTTNRLFLSLALSATLWSVSSYLTDNAADNQRLFWGRLAFVFPVLFTLALASLARVFPTKLKTSRRYWTIISSIALLIVFLCLTNGVVKGTHLRNDGTDLLPGPLYSLFIIAELLLFGAAMRSFYQAKAHATKQQRVQASIVGAGIAIGFLVALLCNVLIPLFFSSDAAAFGPLGTIVFVSMTAYAIVKYQLFDIRSALARSLGYVLTLFVLSGTYGFLVLEIAQHVFNVDIPLGSQLFFALALAGGGLLFQPLRSIFDTLTATLFYRDSYDAQELFDQLNRVLVSGLDVGVLLQHSSKVLSESLNPEYCIIGLSDNNGSYRRFGDTKQSFDQEDILRLRQLTPHMHRHVLIADNLEQRHHDIKQIMRRNNMSVIVRLTPHVHQTEEGIGYILLGPKKSGNPYTPADAAVLENIASIMLIAIQNALHYEEIQQFNAVLQTRVDEATRKLRRTNEKLKALDQAKDEFVSMASHQLRTPLTSIKGYTSMVLEGDAGPINDTQRQLLEQSFSSSQRMVYLIADLLNVSRLKTGKFVLQLSPVNIAELVKQEISQLNETATKRSLTLDYDQPATFPTLQLDETKIRQVIMNFIDNAIYYTPAGGHVRITVTETSAAIALTVTDDGIGVPRADQPHLFTKFYRAGNARTARPDGTGLGLFMAKKVIVAQGGAIIFHTKEGEGSTFGFTFSKTSSV